MEAIVYGPEIKLGVSASVSGKFQLHGQHALDGIRLWQSYANRTRRHSVVESTDTPSALSALLILEELCQLLIN